MIDLFRPQKLNIAHRASPFQQAHEIESIGMIGLIIIRAVLKKMNHKHSIRAFVIFISTSLIQACGSSDYNLDPQLQFKITYSPTPNAIRSNGIVFVIPNASDSRMIGKYEIAKVEFLLFGHAKQEMTKPNFDPKDTVQLTYVFSVPSTFASGIYPCGSGQHLSEVRVTDVTGFVLSKVFELCPGVPLETSALSS